MVVLVPLFAVHDGTESCHAVEVAGDQVFLGPFYLAATERTDILQPFGVGHLGHVVAEVVR